MRVCGSYIYQLLLYFTRAVNDTLLLNERRGTSCKSTKIKIYQPSFEYTSLFLLFSLLTCTVSLAAQKTNLLICCHLFDCPTLFFWAYSVFVHLTDSRLTYLSVFMNHLYKEITDGQRGGFQQKCPRCLCAKLTLSSSGHLRGHGNWAPYPLRHHQQGQVTKYRRIQ